MSAQSYPLNLGLEILFVRSRVDPGAIHALVAQQLGHSIQGDSGVYQVPPTGMASVCGVTPSNSASQANALLGDGSPRAARVSSLTSKELVPFHLKSLVQIDLDCLSRVNTERAATELLVLSSPDGHRAFVVTLFKRALLVKEDIMFGNDQSDRGENLAVGLNLAH